MATAGLKPFNTFVKGFNTESNPLVFPEEHSVDELNMNVMADGSRRRRLGADCESSYALTASTPFSHIDSGAVNCYVWDSPNNVGELSILVVQLGSTIHFYKVVQDSVSKNKYSSTIDLTSFKTSYAQTAHSARVQFASGLGVLIVVGENIEPFYVEFDEDAETFTATQVTIQVRDVDGVDDGFEIDEAVTAGSRTPAKDYNLLNQGWTETNIDAVISGASRLPTNAEIMYLGKNTSGAFASSTLVQQFFGNTPAPRGKYIYNAFYIDRSTTADPDTTEDVSGIAIEETNGRPTTVEFLSGRAWYAGVQQPNKPTRVFFSQVITDLTKIGKCYADGDPTSEHFNELVDTDGGYISLPEAGKIYKLLSFSASMVVFAENGVWQIRGGDNGFTATSFITSRVNDIGAIGPNVVVEAEGGIFYFNDGGIYQVAVDTVSGELTVTSISDGTIQTFYNNITIPAKVNAYGIYDNVGKKVYWFYDSNVATTLKSSRNKFDAVLVLDLRSKGFYKYSLGNTTTVWASVPFIDTNVHIENKREYVTSNSNLIIKSTNDNYVYINNKYDKAAQYKLHFLILNKTDTDYKVTIGAFNNASYLDFEQLLGDNASDPGAWILGSYITMGNWVSKKNSPYIITASQKSETGFVEVEGVLVLENPTEINYRVRADWSDTNDSSKWTDLKNDGYVHERPYMPSGTGDSFETGETMVITRNRLETHGRALQVYFEASSGKEMHIYGFALFTSDAQSF